MQSQCGNLNLHIFILKKDFVDVCGTIRRLLLLLYSQCALISNAKLKKILIPNQFQSLIFFKHSNWNYYKGEISCGGGHKLFSIILLFIIYEKRVIILYFMLLAYYNLHIFIWFFTNFSERERKEIQ